MLLSKPNGTLGFEGLESPEVWPAALFRLFNWPDLACVSCCNVGGGDLFLPTREVAFETLVVDTAELP